MNLTQNDFGNRELSGNRELNEKKQSVLVKRVMRDGVVVSGLERRNEKGNMQRREVLEEDQGTLGS